ncbi:MAG: MBL fold metallo-hydrolase [Pseudomonadota bacterium]|nr:MAG: MBL fold metallo-hydrolase [Pseudomonadota bacterium]
MKIRSRTVGPSLWVLLAAGLAACSGGQPGPQQEAPPPAPPSQTVRQFTIGAMTGFALRDGDLEFPNDNKVFGVGHTPAEVAEVLAAAGLPEDKLTLSLQPLLVKVAGRVMLFDAGAGRNMGEGAGRLLDSLAEAGVKPEDVSDVFISHLHGDHVGGLVNAEGNATFPNATVRISAPEWDALRAMNARTAANYGIQNHRDVVNVIAPSVATFQPGGDVLPGMVRAVEVKGHTPGHSAFRIGTGANSLLYVGDSMHHHVVSLQKPDWHIAFDGDAKTGAASRAALLEELAAGNQRIYAVHFPFPGLGRIQKGDAGFTWVPEQ